MHTDLRYRPDIDGLRGLAVGAVVAFHAFPHRMPGGFTGVDVFFVISGFLITGIILRGVESQGFSYSGFYARRIRRIFPALLIVLTASLAFGWFALFADEYRALGKHVAAGAAFVPNVALWRESGYFDTEAATKPLLHLWSLGVEEQLYLIWPFCLTLLIGKSRRGLSPLVWIVAGSFIVGVVHVSLDPAGAFYLPAGRLWEFGAGALLAVAASRPADGNRFLHWLHGLLCRFDGDRRFASAAGLIGLGLIGLSVFVIDENRSLPGWWALLPVIGAALCIGAGPEGWVNRHLLSWRPLVFVGLISYPLYLWHWPLLALGRVVGGSVPSATVRVALVAGSTLLAWATYQFAEKPIRWRLRGKHIPASLVLSMVLVGTIGLSIAAAAGVPDRIAFGKTDAAAMGEPGWNVADLGRNSWRRRYRQCGDTLLPAIDEMGSCLVSSASRPTRVIIGDSHADHLFPGIAAADSESTWMLASHPACPPLLDVAVHRYDQPDLCAERERTILLAVAQNPDIQIVVLSAIWSWYLTAADRPLAAANLRNRLSSDWRVTDLDRAHTTKRDAFAAGLGRSIRLLTGAGKSVIIHLNVAEMPFSPMDCIRRPLWTRSAISPCGIDRAGVLARQQQYREVVQELARRFDNVRVFDPLEHLCDARFCFMIRDDVMVYRDSRHLSLAGSSALAAKFLPWLDVPSR